MIYKFINSILIDTAIAQRNDFNVLPNYKPENVPDKFSDRNLNSSGGNLSKIIGFVFNFIIAIAAGIFVIMLLVGGVTYLTGAGNDEQTGKGKKMLIDAIIGLFIVLAAWGIGTYILSAFGYRF